MTVQSLVLGKSEERRFVAHELKCWPEFFTAILNGEKKHDLRRSDDREFRVGELVRLREYDPVTQSYSGREQTVEITYITDDDLPCAFSSVALHPNFCILSISLVAE